MQRYKLIIEYDGTNFSGWQKQKEQDTIQQRLEESIIPLTKNHVEIYGAGRTDTGVHALRQTAHFDSKIYLEPFVIQRCMNAHLRNIPITVLNVEKVAQDFHARFSAIERSYIYKILNRKSKPALEINRCWWIMQNLNIEAMNQAAQNLVGKHDFSAFRATGCQAKSPIKILQKISVTCVNDLVTIEIIAHSFLYHQVRNIVGSLYMVGIGKWNNEYFLEILNGKDRTKAGQTAPACGLFFNKVKYSEI